MLEGCKNAGGTSFSCSRSSPETLRVRVFWRPTTGERACLGPRDRTATMLVSSTEQLHACCAAIRARGTPAPTPRFWMTDRTRRSRRGPVCTTRLSTADACAHARAIGAFKNFRAILGTNSGNEYLACACRIAAVAPLAWPRANLRGIVSGDTMRARKP